MSRATKVLVNTASAAHNGSAGLISLTPSGITAHLNRARVDSNELAPREVTLALAHYFPREILT
jgi:hypothetical protein